MEGTDVGQLAGIGGNKTRGRFVPRDLTRLKVSRQPGEGLEQIHDIFKISHL
jgi:hypothetical protein